MARGYYEVPRARPRPAFGPPRPRDKSLPPGNDTEARLQPHNTSSRSRPLHIVVLLASPTTTHAQALLDDLNRGLRTSATIDVVDGVGAMVKALSQGPAIVFTPGLNMDATSDPDLKLALKRHVTNGGQITTDTPHLLALVRQSLGETGRMTRPKQLSVEEVCTTNQAS